MSATQLVTFVFTASDDDGLADLIEAAALELEAFADIQSGELISLYEEPGE